MAADPPDPAAVRAALAEALGADPGELGLTAIGGGASRESWLVAGQGGRWVLRRDPPGAESWVPLEVEHRVVLAATAAGVPAAPPIAFEPAGGRFGSAGFLMDHVEGESIAPRVLRRERFAEARRRLPDQLAAALAAVHAVEPGAIEGVIGGEGDPALEACALWEAQLDRIGEPLPAIEAGLRWLRLHSPEPPPRVTLVHGDFRLGNFIVDERGLAAVIDWELCHAGDPAEDIGWLTIRSWRFGNDALAVAGLGEVAPFLDAYEAAAGWRPEPQRLRWWEAMGNVKWAVICARQAHDHLTGLRPSVELASLGRRICEPEWDMIEVLTRGI
jgi:aminoglycoside phosphotransferase (APT) family kinase protein